MTTEVGTAVMQLSKPRNTKDGWQHRNLGRSKEAFFCRLFRREHGPDGLDLTLELPELGENKFLYLESPHLWQQFEETNTVSIGQNVAELLGGSLWCFHALCLSSSAALHRDRH